MKPRRRHLLRSLQRLTGQMSREEMAWLKANPDLVAMLRRIRGREGVRKGKVGPS
ncbi:MAG: hypothetical protein ACRD1X_13525 [Vicinamibacteria bacterium]